MADDRDGFDWSGWALPGGALIAAAALFLVLLAPWNLFSPTPTANPSPSAPLSEGRTDDEHEVVTEAGIVSFRLEGPEIVVRLERDGGIRELGRTEVLGVATAPPGGTPSILGGSIFAMVCDGFDSTADERYAFGNVQGFATIVYTGPAAIGHAASDGLYLYALLPDAPASSISMSASDGSGAGLGPAAFERAREVGRKQPSGCFVSG